jgi:hypothetical protein
MSTGAKVALGCGIAFVVIIGGCLATVGGVAYWGVKKGSAVFDQAWGDIRRDVQELQTDEGARKLYQDNPGLATRYPTVEEFQKASTGWRAKLSDFPEKRPEIKEILSSQGGIQFNVSEHNGVKSTSFRYPLPRGGVLRVETENDLLVDIGVD